MHWFVQATNAAVYTDARRLIKSGLNHVNGMYVDDILWYAFSLARS